MQVVQRSKKGTRLAVAALALLATAGTAQAGLVFNLIDPTNLAGTAPNAYNGFVQAAGRWSALFNDNVTINLEIGFTNLGGGILGSTDATDAIYSYASVRSALLLDATSADDATAVAHLPNVSGGTALNMMLNYTSNSPNGSGSSVPYLDNDGDANNTTLRISTANAKALGLLAGNNAATDASITFNSSFSFDFNPDDGITPSAYDFVGIATHEIGHALGFFSGVDILDTNSSNPFFPDNAFTYVTTLDLYRRSALSLVNGGDNTIDWTAGPSNAYFSLDGGASNLALFSTGIVHGDGRQASHWKDNLGIGIMDPTFNNGELGVITATDVRSLDVIGWNRADVASTAPEPATLALAALGLPLFLARRRRAG